MSKKCEGCFNHFSKPEGHSEDEYVYKSACWDCGTGITLKDYKIDPNFCYICRNFNSEYPRD